MKKSRRDIPQAKFWIWVNDGPVRLCVKQGQWLRWHMCAQTEEGCLYLQKTWILNGALVTEFVNSEESDCDGFKEIQSRHSCCVFKLREWDDLLGYHFPDWTTEKHEVNHLAARNW